jgi:hypothetical protein
MATTTNFNFNLPAIGGDSDAWGTKLNNNWTSLRHAAVCGGGGAARLLILDDYTANAMTLTAVASIDIDGPITEQVHTLGTSGTVDVDAANGTVQTIAMSGDVTIESSLTSGQFVTLRFTSVGGNDDVTWPTMEWMFGSPPSLEVGATNWIQIWNVGSTLYGTYLGYTS